MMMGDVSRKEEGRAVTMKVIAMTVQDENTMIKHPTLSHGNRRKEIIAGEGSIDQLRTVAGAKGPIGSQRARGTLLEKTNGVVTITAVMGVSALTGKIAEAVVIVDVDLNLDPLHEHAHLHLARADIIGHPDIGIGLDLDLGPQTEPYRVPISAGTTQKPQTA